MTVHLDEMKITRFVDRLMVSVLKAEGTDYRGSKQPNMSDRVPVGRRRVYTGGDPADFSFNAMVVALGCASDGLFLVLREITGDDIGGRWFGGILDMRHSKGFMMLVFENDFVARQHPVSKKFSLTEEEQERLDLEVDVSTEDLDKFRGAEQPSTIKFLEADFWVHVLNLPLGSMNSSVGERIGNKTGKYISMGVTPSQQIWEKPLKIRVRIDITTPLQRGMRIHMGKNESAWVVFQYERLPIFAIIVEFLATGKRIASSSCKTQNQAVSRMNTADGYSTSLLELEKKKQRHCRQEVRPVEMRARQRRI
ncbi:hypothetical protein RJ640_009818 [Escallonia rubra]|uniref:Zinc knuckle CX2CX4HX4C domain-containing protein n=1 Tax=Escallonia rubra TaxID=112253 RepID=A0AA88QNC6_9ASTE|nr:hypothetical protein RJ640_009818 [Escallonia rubra]